MSDEINSLIENEKEWRRYVVKKLDTIVDKHHQHGREIERLKIWNTIWRSMGTLIIGAITWFLKEHK